MLSLYDIFTRRLYPSDPEIGKVGSITLNIALIQAVGYPLFGAREESNKYRITMTLYSIVVMSLITFTYSCLEVWDLFDVWGDLTEVTRNTCMSFTHFAGILKMINIFYRRNDIIRVIEQLRIMTQKYVTSEKQKIEFDRSELENKVAFLFYFGLVTCTSLIAVVFLFKDHEKAVGKMFPFRAKMPEFLPPDLRVIYMAISVNLIPLQVVSIDFLNIVLMNQIRYQMKIIHIAFDSLCFDDPTTLQANEVINSIAEHHNWILEIHNDVESIFKYSVLLQFFTSLSIFALTGFQVTVQPHTPSTFVVYLYCGCIFYQLFIYCWYGNEVSEQNKTLALGGYNSPWYRFDQKFRKSLIIFLINAQQPCVFTAGGFTVLSLTTFSGILSKSYTYIAVLRQMYSE